MVDDLYRSPGNLDEPVVPETPISHLKEEDNKTGRIKAMAVLQIVLGALCGLFALLAFFGLAANAAMGDGIPEAQRSPLGSMIYSLLFYVALAVSLIWVGIGGVRLRRWVRPVVLAINWPILVMGVLSVIGVIWVMPEIMRQAGAVATSTTEMPAGFSDSLDGIITVMTGIIVFLFVVALPGLHVLLYRSESVQATLDAYDSKERWTDDKPLSIVGLAIWLAVTSFNVLGMSMAGMWLFFGFAITGAGAWIVGLLIAGGCVVLSRLALRRSPVAWWGTIVLWVLLLGAAISPALMDLSEVYRQTGMYNETQIAMMASMDHLYSTAIPALVGIAWLFALAFLIAIKKRFSSLKSQRA